MDQRLAHTDVLQQRVVKAKRQLVAHPVGAGGNYLDAVVFQVRLHRSGDLTHHVRLSGDQRAGAHRLLGGKGVVDAI